MIIFLCGKIEKVKLASITGLLSHCYNVSTLVKSHLFELITYNQSPRQTRIHLIKLLQV